jgi:uncharacterized protein (TIGR02246 family)
MAQTGGEADERAIRAVMDRFMDAWNHHDAEAFAAVFSQDADFTNVRGVSATGRAKIEAFHAPVFATIFSRSHQEYTDIKTRFLRPDVAAVDVRWKMTGAMDPQGNSRPERTADVRYGEECGTLGNCGDAQSRPVSAAASAEVSGRRLCPWGILNSWQPRCFPIRLF